MVRGAKNQYFYYVAEVSFSNSGFRTEGWGGVKKERDDGQGWNRKKRSVCVIFYWN